MKLIELHILQSFPVSCLNRDDVGAPKTATFGGVTRARISSQCLKRAIREQAKELNPKFYAAKRSRLFTPEITKRLPENLRDEAEALAKCAAHYLGKLDPKDNTKVKTVMFLSPDEYGRLAKVLAELPEEGRKELCEALARVGPGALESEEAEGEADSGETTEPKRTRRSNGEASPLTAKQFTKRVESVLRSPIKRAFGTGFVKDAADIAIFGRMVASDQTLGLDGAGMFNHALSTHKTANDIDFFSAVDELQRREEAGAGMTGTLEFNSATYYRYVGLNVGLLVDTDHLAALTKAERKKVVDAFVRAAILAVPGARKNSMNANTLPGYVLGVVMEEGQPLQLINAFERPVFSKSGNGLMDPSVTALKEHHESLKKTWGIKPVAQLAIPDKTLNEFCEEIITHVD